MTIFYLNREIYFDQRKFYALYCMYISSARGLGVYWGGGAHISMQSFFVMPLFSAREIVLLVGSLPLCYALALSWPIGHGGLTLSGDAEL